MGYKKEQRYEFNTRHETKFLDNLGTWGQPTHAARDRIKLLEGYLKSCKYRKTWGGINKEQVITYAQELLFEERRL